MTATWRLFWLLAQAAATTPAAPAPDRVAAPPAGRARAEADSGGARAAAPGSAAAALAAVDGDAVPPVADVRPRAARGRRAATPGMATNAVGIDMAFPSNSYVRNHLGLAHQWESAGAYSARGFGSI